MPEQSMLKNKNEALVFTFVLVKAHVVFHLRLGDNNVHLRINVFDGNSNSNWRNKCCSMWAKHNCDISTFQRSQGNQGSEQQTISLRTDVVPIKFLVCCWFPEIKV